MCPPRRRPRSSKRMRRLVFAGLRYALSVLALIAIVALLLSRGIPSVQPSSERQTESSLARKFAGHLTFVMRRLMMR